MESKVEDEFAVGASVVVVLFSMILLGMMWDCYNRRVMCLEALKSQRCDQIAAVCK